MKHETWNMKKRNEIEWNEKKYEKEKNKYIKKY